MKFSKILFCCITALLFSSYFIHGQEKIGYEFQLSSILSSEENLPFWMVSNQFGLIPNSNNAIASVSFFSSKEYSNSNFNFNYKASVAGYVADKNDVFIKELFGEFEFNSWLITIGSKYDEILYDGLSSSNGNIIKSNNTRATPGINVQTKGFLQLPFAKNWLSFKANYAEYLLNDERIVDNVHLHQKSLHFKSTLSPKLDLIVGLDHYVQWGGTSEEYGKLASSFSDYLRMVTGSSGGEDSSFGERINALGNHVGNYIVQLDFYGNRTNWQFYWSHLFEDRSGRELSNYPDALYGIFIDLKQPENKISHLLFELTYTKHQGLETSINGLSDHYFNNKIYESGWTFYGNTIGSPFFIPRINSLGLSEGIYESYSRFIAYHVGVNGKLTKNFNYTTKLSHVNYAGQFGEALENKKITSGIFQIDYQNERFPFQLSLGGAFDTGSFTNSNIGGFIKLTKKGIF